MSSVMFMCRIFFLKSNIGTVWDAWKTKNKSHDHLNEHANKAPTAWHSFEPHGEIFIQVRQN